MTKNTKNLTAGVDSNSCYCGCGTPTSSARSIYRPGHDAKHVSVLLAEIFAQRKVWHDSEDELVALFIQTASRLPSGALRVKLNNAFAKRIYREFDKWHAAAEKNRDAETPFAWHPDEFFAILRNEELKQG